MKEPTKDHKVCKTCGYCIRCEGCECRMDYPTQNQSQPRKQRDTKNF